MAKDEWGDGQQERKKEVQMITYVIYIHVCT